MQKSKTKLDWKWCERYEDMGYYEINMKSKSFSGKNIYKVLENLDTRMGKGKMYQETFNKLIKKKK